ncbi:MAG: CPBP family intramembrane metalloprotease [Chloroflexi bacterium]|nr:CPBP family intramembrane metalloprotease [Chloroflexota bacterium]
MPRGQRLGRAASFTALTFAVSWLIPLLFWAFGGNWNTPPAIAVALLYMFVPMSVALFLQRLVYREPVSGPLGVSFRPNRWFLAAWLLPPVLAFAALGVSLLLPGVSYAPGMEGFFQRLESVFPADRLAQMKEQAASFPVHPLWLGLAQGLVAGPTVNALAGFGEELGWRGFLQKELGFLGFWKSAGVIGLIWGIWHFPLILQGHNYPQHPVAGVGMMTLFALLLSPLFSYVRLKARSVIAAAIIHGSLNATAGLATLVVAGGSDLTVGATGLAGLIVLAFLDLGLFVYNRGRSPMGAERSDSKAEVF